MSLNELHTKSVNMLEQTSLKVVSETCIYKNWTNADFSKLTPVR